jgi:hypothetical protein
MAAPAHRPRATGATARGALAVALVAASLASPGPAQAEPPAPGAGSSSPPVPPAPSGAATAPLRLVVSHRGPTVPWELELENRGSTPLLVAADPRLLWLEVKVPGKKTTTTCQLPPEVFPTRPDPATELLLAPGEKAAHRFDPRLYCYGESGQSVLVPGAQVSPRFGWPETHKTRWVNGRRVDEVVDGPPHVAQVLDAAPATPRHAHRAPPRPDPAHVTGTVKVVSGDGFALGSEYAAWSRARLPGPVTDSGPLRLTLEQGSDAEAERTATVRLSLVNRGTEARYVYFRRELLSFEVVGPTGLASCDAEPDLRAPDRSAYQRLAPGQSITVNNRLVELCPRGTFAIPGLYLVHARFDATHDGEEFDLDAVVGRVATDRPVGVRIRTGEKPPPRRMERVPRTR